jgi:aspartate aminotransferase-like enzyme
MVIRNGWFSFRWTQIFEAGNIPSEATVMMARQTGNDPQAPFVPVPVGEMVARIIEERPAVVFAPHVETSSGVILPDDYIRAVAEAVHAVGGLFVLDCIASGCIWVDMKALGVDVVISAPQKGWSASPCAGLVMMSAAARAKVAETQSSSFAMSLQIWTNIMEAYENGGHAYHATMPTDALKVFRDVMLETQTYGFDKLKAAQQALGDGVRALMAKRGFKSVAADGFGAPGVVVCFTDDGGIQNGSKFAAQGVQIAAGVPLRCDEPEGFSSFRIGMFGLDKLYDVDATIARLDAAFDAIG